jgi:hypothetical protein
MLLSTGMRAKKPLKALRPPADAPMPMIKPPTCCSCVSEPDVSELGAFDPRGLPRTALSLVSEALGIPRLVDLVISPSQCSELWHQYSQPPQRRPCSRLRYGMAVPQEPLVRSGRDLFALALSGHTAAPAITDINSRLLIAAAKGSGQGALYHMLETMTARAHQE